MKTDLYDKVFLQICRININNLFKLHGFTSILDDPNTGHDLTKQLSYIVRILEDTAD